MVNERLTDRGIDVGYNKTHGDGVRFARTLEPFHHLDEGAELVAFSPEDHRSRLARQPANFARMCRIGCGCRKKQCQTTRSGRL